MNYQKITDAAGNLGDWQSIDTAPLDGTWVMLCGGHCEGEESEYDGRPVVAQWTPHPNGAGRWQFAWYDGGYFGSYGGPTHWMPLPSQPTLSQK